MRARDLDLRELLSFEPGGGILHFAGERVLLLDAVALGLLRKLLIDTLGVAGARGVLTRFGFAHGWRTAESLRTAFPWDDEDEWRRAGGRLHTLQGLVVVLSPNAPDAPEAPGGDPPPGPKPMPLGVRSPPATISVSPVSRWTLTTLPRSGACWLSTLRTAIPVLDAK